MPPLLKSDPGFARWPTAGRGGLLPTNLRPQLRLVEGAAGDADRYGFLHTRTSPAAIAAFEKAVHAVAAHRPNAAPAIERALAAEPLFTAAHALRGFAQVILAREEMIEPARASLRAARAAAAAGATGDELALVEALAPAVEGRFADAARRLDRSLERNPHAFLLVKLAHALRFMIGDAVGMVETTGQALACWREAQPGCGFLLGCHAFGLEELGQYGQAEALGRRAVALQPDDAWGMHAVSHVHEMQGRTGEGIAWLEATRPAWSGCNNFSFHMSWHLALFHLERGEHERVLDLYDREVRPRPSDDFRDVANAVSLLWRLRQDGVAAGGRWDELRDIASRRRTDTTLAFAALHNLLALVATGDFEAARALRGAMSARAKQGAGEQAEAMATVACEFADVLLGLGEAGARPADLARLAARLPRLGGSHAQRDLFVRTLAEIACDRGDRAALARLMTLRRRLKRDDRFAASIAARCDDEISLSPSFTGRGPG